MIKLIQLSVLVNRNIIYVQIHFHARSKLYFYFYFLEGPFLTHIYLSIKLFKDIQVLFLSTSNSFFTFEWYLAPAFLL
jgi:hypothetical protein